MKERFEIFYRQISLFVPRPVEWEGRITKDDLILWWKKVILIKIK